LYYSEENSSTASVETTFNQQNVLSLASLSFNGTSNVYIPIDQFLSSVVLHLKLPNIVANQAISRGWGYSMIQSIGWTLGASNSTTIFMDGASVLQAVLAQCDTAEKKSELLRLGGEEYLSPYIPPAGASDDLEAYVFLPLPFSSLCGHLPLDTTLLSNNISLVIQFKSAAAIYGGSAVRPSAFTAAEIMLRQGKLSNQNSSIKDVMISDPSLMYAYPFIFTQSFNGGQVVGSSVQSSPCRAVLNTFLNADLLGIALTVVKASDISPSANSTPNPTNFADLSNVLVTFNGTTLFRYPGKSYKLANMAVGKQGPGYMHGSVIAPGASSPFASTPVDAYQLYLDFSFERGACLHDHLQNVWRLPNQQIQVEFNTPETGVQYVVHATYFYNAVAEFQNGTSAVYIG
jgi:hypothetical protein